MLISIAIVFWGLSFLSIKVAVASIPPVSLALFRFVLASVFLFVLVRIREPDARMERRDILRFAGTGVIGITAYFLCENYGVYFLSASEASIIVGSIPMLTLLGEILFFKKKTGLLHFIGVALSFVGVAFVVGFLPQGKLYGKPLGYLLMAGASLSWVAYSFLTRPLAPKYSNLAITFFQTLFGTLAFVPFALLEIPAWRPVSGLVVLNVVFLGICCSALGYYFYVHAMRTLGIAVSALFVNLIPAVTILAGFLILHERLSATQIGGAVLVLAAVFVSGLSDKRRD